MINRTQVSALAISAAALVSIALSEGYRSDAYIPVPGDVPTIGFGETSGVKLGDKTTPERSLANLLTSADKHANEVRKCIQVPLYQGEFDAYVSLAYNIGTNAFCKSTLVKKLNAGDYPGACKEILRWSKFKGRDLPGLVKRRQQEHAMCIGSGL